ncbi:MAG TPA: hypothetical protein VFP69_19415 [Streptomyces sp.]|nr:hypothetical protein [Streptomyces sp.]
MRRRSPASVKCTGWGFASFWEHSRLLVVPRLAAVRGGSRGPNG